MRSLRSAAFSPVLALALLLPALAPTAASAAEPPSPPPVVYVPYDKVPATDPKGAGVLLPYEEFRRLWEASQRPVVDPAKPPVGAALTAFALTGTVVGEVANLTLSGTVAALSPGWSSVTLPAGLAVANLTGSDERLVLERGADGLRLHLPAAGTWTFTAEVAAPVARDAAGLRTLDLVLPSAGSGRLELQLPEAGAELTVAPALAVAIQPGGTAAKPAGTTIRAVVGGQPSVRLSWRAPVAAAAGEALILSEGSTVLTVGERALGTDTTLTLTVLRRALADLAIRLPEGTQVLAVEAPGLRTWERDGDLLRLHTHEAKEGQLAVHLKLERLLPAAAQAARPLELALPQVVGAERQTGIVALRADEGLALTVTAHEGLSQIDPAEIGADGAAAAFRYLAPPPALALTALRLEPDLRVQLHQLVRLASDETRIDVAAELTVRRAGVFTLTAPLPEGWELVDAGGLEIDDSRTVAAAAGTARHLELALRSRLLGDGQLTLRFRAPAALPRSGGVQKLDVGLLTIDGARLARGTLAIAAPRSWALSAVAADGLAGADAHAAAGDPLLADAVRGLRDDEEVALAWSWLAQGQAQSQVLGQAQPQAAQIHGPTLAAQPRSREVVAHQEELVLVSEGTLRRTVTWRGEVRYSAIQTLRLRLPAALAPTAQVKAAGLAERSVLPGEHGEAAIELRFQTPLIGPFAITLETSEALPRLEAGKPATIALAVIAFDGATRGSALTAVARDGSVTITASAAGGAARGLDTLATADLPPTLQGPGTVAAFRGAAPGPLTLAIERHDLVVLTDAAIPGVAYRGALGDDGRLRVAGWVQVESRGRPHLELRLPADADLLEVAVDGRQTRPSRRADGALVIPLGERAAASGSHFVAFAYEQQVVAGGLGSSATLTFTLPTVGGAAEGRALPVERTTVDLFLPARLAPLAVGGDLRETGEQDQAVTLRADGLTSTIPEMGRRLHLSRLGEGGAIHVGLLAGGALDAIGVIAGLVVLILGWLLRRRVRAAMALAAFALAVATVALAAGAVWATLVDALVLGAALTAVLAAISGWRARHRATAPPVPVADPWLAEPVPVAPVVGSAEPVVTAEASLADLPPAAATDLPPATPAENGDKPADQP